MRGGSPLVSLPTGPQGGRASVIPAAVTAAPKGIRIMARAL